MKSISKKGKIIIISVSAFVVICALIFGIVFGVVLNKEPNKNMPGNDDPISGEEHEHSFSDRWSSDENMHWHAATCEHSNETSDLGGHVWDGGVIEEEATAITEGKVVYCCLICGYERTVIVPVGQHIHTFYNDWKSDANYHWHTANCEHTYEISKKDVHEWDDGVVDIPATENSDGEKIYTCVICKRTKTEIIEKLPSSCDHHFDMKTTSDEFLKFPATCTSSAIYYYSCSCGTVGTETFEYGDPLGHSFTDYKYNNDSTCTSDGTSTAKCDRCNETDTIVSENTKIAHSYTQKTISSDYFIKAADCLHAEKYYYSCVCGLKGTETFDFGEPLGHCFVNYVFDNNATCDADGTKTAQCEYCDITDTLPAVDTKTDHTYSDAWSSDDEYHWHSATCTHSGQVSGKSIHNLIDGIIILEPATGVEGIMQYTCADCDKIVYIRIGVAGHTHTYSSLWSSDDTYHWHSADCGHDLLKQDIGEHNYNDGTITKIATHMELGEKIFACLDCGKQKVEKIEKLSQHTFGEWVYGNALMHKHVCECGEIAIEDHSWEVDSNDMENDETVLYHCTVCGGTKTEYLNIKKFNVQFVDYDGTVLSEQRVLPGANAVAPIEPDRDGYRFVKWNKSYLNVQGDIKIIAQYVKTFTVEFVDYNGVVFDLQIVDVGESAIIPESSPFRRNYRFIGWDRSVTNVIADITVNALYMRQYSVVFVDYDGTVLKEEQMVDMYGNAILPSKTPEREGYSFKGWDKSNKNITENSVITAMYDFNYYTVTFKVNGQAISTQNIRYGLNATQPQIDEIYFDWDKMTGYRFTGWSEQFIEIFEDTEIIAIYDEKITEPIIAVETVSVNRGSGVEEMKVSVYLISTQTLYGLSLDLKYNSALTLTQNNVEVKNGFGNANVYVNIDQKNSEVEFIGTFGSGIEVNNYVEVLEFTFKFSRRIEPGDYLIEFIENNYYVNNDLIKESPIVINGKISVTE